MRTRIEAQMDFLREIDKLKQIGRQSYLTDGKRKENDAEHSWHLAMCALVLREYAPEGGDGPGPRSGGDLGGGCLRL